MSFNLSQKLIPDLSPQHKLWIEKQKQKPVYGNICAKDIQETKITKLFPCQQELINKKNKNLCKEKY